MTTPLQVQGDDQHENRHMIVRTDRRPLSVRYAMPEQAAPPVQDTDDLVFVMQYLRSCGSTSGSLFSAWCLEPCWESESASGWFRCMSRRRPWRFKRSRALRSAFVDLRQIPR